MFVLNWRKEEKTKKEKKKNKEKIRQSHGLERRRIEYPTNWPFVAVYPDDAHFPPRRGTFCDTIPRPVNEPASDWRAPFPASRACTHTLYAAWSTRHIVETPRILRFHKNGERKKKREKKGREKKKEKRQEATRRHGEERARESVGRDTT